VSLKAWSTPTLEPTIKEVGDQKPKEELEAKNFFFMIKGCLKTIECIDLHGSVTVSEMSLVPNIVIHPNFTVLKFAKYMRVKCLKILS
jgi:hypothetical protein